MDLNPAHAIAHQCLGAVSVMAGQPEEGFPHLKKAIELSPHDLWMGSFLARLAEAYVFSGDYENAEKFARDALRQPSGQGSWTNHVILISALGHLGKYDDATQAIQNLEKVRSGITCEFVRRHDHMAPENHIDEFIEGLRKAGLPE